MSADSPKTTRPHDLTFAPTMGISGPLGVARDESVFRQKSPVEILADVVIGMRAEGYSEAEIQMILEGLQRD